MSTYWGYVCKTCPFTGDLDEDAEWEGNNNPSDSWMNHGDQTLRSLALVRSHLKAVVDGDTTGYLEVTVMAYGSAPIHWLVKHADHEIELRNEYGKTVPITP